jgi:hypothetical protein
MTVHLGMWASYWDCEQNNCAKPNKETLCGAHVWFLNEFSSASHSFKESAQAVRQLSNPNASLRCKLGLTESPRRPCSWRDGSHTKCMVFFSTLHLHPLLDSGKFHLGDGPWNACLEQGTATEGRIAQYLTVKITCCCPRRRPMWRFHQEK